MAKTTKLVGYGISFDMKLVGGVKTADDFRRAAKSVQKSVNKATDATKQHKLQMEALNQAFRKGAMNRKQYEQALNSLNFKEMRRQQRIEKERRAVQGLDQQEAILSRNRQRRARMAGMAASATSGLGFGGSFAGAARFLGGVGLGKGAALMGGGFLGALGIQKSLAEFSKLESNVVALQVLFGEGLGNRLQNEFRELAKTTILTNSQLVENAKIWASYGLTTEGMTERLKRLGSVAAVGGGSVAEKFKLLTRAFAQVNAMGKLMGQEKLQLVNAGFSLKAVADAAGVSMDDFSKAMEDGRIKAEHLNQALINVTSKGGQFEGMLEELADTLSGKMTILRSESERLMQILGAGLKKPAGLFLDKLIEAAKASKEFVTSIDKLNTFSAGTTSKDHTPSGVGELPDTTSGVRRTLNLLNSFVPRIFPESYLEMAKNRSQPLSGNKAHRTYKTGTPIIGPNLGPFGNFSFGLERYMEGIDNSAFNMPKGAYADPFMQSLSFHREAGRIASQEIQAESMSLALARAFEKALADNVSDEVLSGLFSQAKDQMQDEAVRKGFVKKYGIFASENLPQDDFNEMQDMALDFEKDKRDREMLLQNKIEFETALYEAEMQRVNDVRDAEITRINNHEKIVREALEKERKIAAGPEQKDAMFTGGSVEEFMFLRRQTQINETAKAVKEAENRASEQRKQIEADRKAADEKRDSAITELKNAIFELTTKISNLD